MQINFNRNRVPATAFALYEKIIEDRGSKYSVSIGKVTSRDDIKDFLLKLKADKKYAKATHNSWAVRISHDGAIFESKNDDGEAGAGMVILRSMQRSDAIDCIICVTRWFGGVKLQGDRFRHVQGATVYAIEHGLQPVSVRVD